MKCRQSWKREATSNFEKDSPIATAGVAENQRRQAVFIRKNDPDSTTPSKTDRSCPAGYKSGPDFLFAPAVSAGNKSDALPLGSRRLLGRREHPRGKPRIL